MNQNPPQRPPGFTLVELMATIAVLIIVLAFAIPSLTDLISRARVTQITNTLVGHLQFARSAAVKRGRDRVAVGPYDSSGAWKSGSAWEGGYMVANVTGGTVATIQQVLRRVDGTELAGVTITTNSTSPRFYFLKDGTSTIRATLTICDKTNPTNARVVVVDGVGRIRASQYRTEGTAITCPPN